MNYFSMLFGLVICQNFSQGSNLNSIKLFVKLSSWAKGVHPLAPSSIRSFFQIQAHEFNNFFLSKSVLCIYISKWDMVRQCHLYNFTKFSFAVFNFHIFCLLIVSPLWALFNVKQLFIKWLTQQLLFDHKIQMFVKLQTLNLLKSILGLFYNE